VNTESETFHSSTSCASRWAMSFTESPQLPDAIAGYLLELLAFGNLGYDFMSVVVLRMEGHYEIWMTKRYGAKHPVPLMVYSPDELRENTYLRIRLPASVETHADATLALERLTSMVMHGKLGPHEGPDWTERFCSYTKGSVA